MIADRGDDQCARGRNVCCAAVFCSAVDTKPHIASLRVPRCPALVAFALACVLVGVGASGTAGAVELGISDSDAPTVIEPFWDGLHVTRARIVVPYDVATTTGDAGTQRRESFEAYRINAAAKGVSLLVVFATERGRARARHR